MNESFVYETDVVKSSDGENGIFLNIFRKRNAELKRGLLIIHGQGEHGARYQHFTEHLKDQYDIILAPDLRGHGRSEGIRGHVATFDEYVDDAFLGFEQLQTRMAKGARIDWFGHSMGGAVSLRAIHFRPDLPIRNFILSSPGVALALQVPLPKLVAAKVLAQFWGSLSLPSGIKDQQLSHDPAYLNDRALDQLNHTKASPDFYFGFEAAMEEIRENELRLSENMRVLVQLAGEDTIVSTAATETWFQHQLHAAHKRLIVYPGLYHEVYNEITKEHVFQDLKDWIESTS